MADRPPPSAIDSIAAAQAWWREAGVDLAFHDAPRPWLAPEPEPGTDAASRASSITAEPVEEAPRIGGAPAEWPRDLASFVPWWLDEPSLDPVGGRGRVPPRGAAGPSLMIVVAMPEESDQAELLAGREGRLVANMARAMGIGAEQTYLASALPRHMPVPAWTHLRAAGLGEVLRHHIGLVAPMRLIVLGRDVWSLLAHDPAQSAPPVSDLSIHSGTVPLLCSYAPGRLLEHPRLRQALWRQWLEWTDGVSV